MESKNAAADSAVKTRRRPGSFVLKLTLAQSLRMLKLLFFLNIMMVLLYAGLSFIDLEHAVVALAAMPPESAAGAASLSGATASRETEDIHGLRMRGKLEEKLVPWLGLQPGATRSFAFRDAPGEPYLWGKWEVRPVYTVSAPGGEGGFLRVEFDLRGRFGRFVYAMLAVACVELLMLVSNTAGARRAIRGTLAPIQQLALTTRNISTGKAAKTEETAERGAREKREKKQPKQPELRLSGTIDTLNKITGEDLHARIPLEGERAELRGLAAAINAMLDRLDAAYSSQLRFVSDASHELRTPIAVLQGYANMLDRWGKEDPAVLQESIEAIKAESEGMKVLVEQLLFLARGDNNTIVLQVQPLDICDYAEEVLRETELVHEGYEYIGDFNGPLWVEGDGGLLKQALRIFVDNAVKYSPDGGAIRIGGAVLDGWARISITDNGIGIPERDIAHVFERFFRSDESRARATGGTGLGLSIAKWIVERHGGYLEILSREEIGTRMTLVLPAAEAPAGSLDEEVV